MSELSHTATTWRESGPLLVVDDDPRVRQSLESLLSSAGYRVRLYSSALELLGFQSLEDAGCLITDIRMPLMSGWELLRRAAIVHPGLPVIFVTAHGDKRAAGRALESGAFAFFHKPFDSEELLAAVEAALRSHTRQDDGVAEV